MIEEIHAIGINKFYDNYLKLSIISFTVRTENQSVESPSQTLTYYVDSKRWSDTAIYILEKEIKDNVE